MVTERRSFTRLLRPRVLLLPASESLSFASDFFAMATSFYTSFFPPMDARGRGFTVNSFSYSVFLLQFACVDFGFIWFWLQYINGYLRFWKRKKEKVTFGDGGGRLDGARRPRQGRTAEALWACFGLPVLCIYLSSLPLFPCIWCLVALKTFPIFFFTVILYAFVNASLPWTWPCYCMLRFLVPWIFWMLCWKIIFD